MNFLKKLFGQKQADPALVKALSTPPPKKANTIELSPEQWAKFTDFEKVRTPTEKATLAAMFAQKSKQVKTVEEFEEMESNVKSYLRYQDILFYHEAKKILKENPSISQEELANRVLEWHKSQQ
jgi:hypothetical protein